MPIPNGAVLGPYAIRAPLGAGGMGEVYRAIDSRLERDVAIKVLPDEVAADPERLARFQREARLLASLPSRGPTTDRWCSSAKGDIAMIAQYAKIYVAALVGFLAIDMLWLGVVARGFYRRHLGFLFADQVNWWAAFSFYLLFVAGVLVFAVVPALQAGSLSRALLLGGLLGLLTYGTYDLTNLATVKSWPLVVTLVDMVWGTVLTAAVSGIGYLAGTWSR